MPGFSVNIGADTAQLSLGIKEAKAEIVSFQNSLGNGNNFKIFESLNSGITNLNTSIKQLIGQIDNIPQALAKGKSAVKDFGDVAEGSILEARLTVNRLKAELISLGPAARQSEAGKFLANELKIATAELKTMEMQAGLTSAKAENVFGQAFSGIRKIAYLIPGIGIAGLLGLVTEPLFDFVKGLAGFSEAAKKAKEEANGFNKALSESNTKAGEELARVQVLNAVITDNTRTQKDRASASSDLSKILKDLNIEMSKEEILNGNVAKATKLATDAIIERARARAIEGRIGDLSGQILNNDIKRLDLTNKLTKAQKSLNDQQIIQRQVIGGSTIGVGGNTIGATQQVINLRDSITEVDNATARANNEIATLIGMIKDNDLNVKFDNTKSKKEEDTLAKQLSLLEKIRDAQKEFTGKMFDLKNIDEATDKLASLEQQVGNLKLQIAVRDAKKAGLPAAEIEKLKDAIKQDTEKRLNEAFEKEALLLEFSTKLKFSPVNKAEIPANIDSQIAKATGFDKRIPEITLHEARVRILGAKLTEKIEFREKITKELNDALNEAVKNLKIDAVSGIADALGEALSGGDIKNVFKSLFNVIASGLQQFGKALISYGLAQKAFQIATKSLNPALAIAAGAGLIIAGAALRASLPKFATGGIVTGPLIGQIGEMHRPEVIMPLDRLPQMLRSIGGGGGNDLQFIPIINNEGLYLAVQRGARRVGRKF